MVSKKDTWFEDKICQNWLLKKLFQVLITFTDGCFVFCIYCFGIDGIMGHMMWLWDGSPCSKNMFYPEGHRCYEYQWRASPAGFLTLRQNYFKSPAVRMVVWHLTNLACGNIPISWVMSPFHNKHQPSFQLQSRSICKEMEKLQGPSPRAGGAGATTGSRHNEPIEIHEAKPICSAWERRNQLYLLIVMLNKNG